MKLLTKTDYSITNGSGSANLLLEYALEDILETFGNPTTIGSGDNKVQLQWTFVEGDKVITIYDYKANKPIHEIKYWHIGSKNISKEEVVKFFSANGLVVN